MISIRNNWIKHPGPYLIFDLFGHLFSGRVFLSRKIPFLEGVFFDETKDNKVPFSTD